MQSVLQKLPSGLTSRAGRSILLLQKTSPTILFGVGVVGFGATIVTASRATLSADKIVYKYREDMNTIETLHLERADEYPMPDVARDKVIVISRTAMALVRHYGPSIALGTLTVAAFGGAQHILNTRNAALTLTLGSMETGFREYRKRVQSAIGLDKEETLFHNSTKEVVSDLDGKKTTVHRVDPNGYSMYARFFDETCTAWVRGARHENFVFLRTTQQYWNDMLKYRGHVFLNEVYDALGMERTPAGSVVGWLRGEGDDFVDFGIFDETKESARRFINGYDDSIRLDFNVDGVIYDKI